MMSFTACPALIGPWRHAVTILMPGRDVLGLKINEIGSSFTFPLAILTSDVSKKQDFRTLFQIGGTVTPG